jgi:uncharacterized protein (TIGR03083 family)
MEIDEHIAALRREGVGLASAAATAGLDARVPSCPDWVLRDLVRHQGGVHRWATEVVAGPRTEAFVVDLDDVVGEWPRDQDLLDWFREGHASLVATLSQAAPDLDCWTFLRAPSPLAMWARRQAHETAVHRVDAELAAGARPTPIPAPFAADGVDELLACFVTRPGGRLRSDPVRILHVGSIDAPGDWTVRIGPDGADILPVADDAECHVTGQAADLYLALWNRRDTAGLAIEGEGEVLDLFLDRVHVRWS